MVEEREGAGTATTFPPTRGTPRARNESRGREPGIVPTIHALRQAVLDPYTIPNYNYIMAVRVFLWHPLQTSMADNKLPLLAARYPHVVPVDPSLASTIIQNNGIQGHVAAAILALIIYNARYVA